MKICIFGAASSLIAPRYTEVAYEVGKHLAKAGIYMVFGGGNEGMMGACARGVHAQRGHVTGIIPEFFKDGEGELLYEDCDEVIYTPDIRTRIKLMEEMSDGFIVLPGGVGTLEEFFDIYVSLCLDRMAKPMAVLDVNGYFDPLMDMLRKCVDQGFLSRERLGKFQIYQLEELPEMMKYLQNFPQIVAKGKDLL